MIQLKNVTFRYPRRKPLFSDLSLELEGNHIYGLLGKNGEGKTTLMKLMSGLLFAKEGSIETLGEKACLRRPKMLEEIYFLPEEMYVPSISIQEFETIFSPFYPRFSSEQFHNYMELFEITDFRQNLMRMSHGQKKKVLIAFAMATNCQIVFMDEPSNGLDIPSKSIFRKVMASAADEQRMIIISTHQVRDLHSLIDTILILDQGEILLNAPVEQITEKLLFKVVDTEGEAQTALYKEDTLRGIYAVFENINREDSKMDIELLFNSALCNRDKIKEIFSLQK
ncbi:MAG: ABC transporter ATP-binding protein [Bacteroidales bacterium]|nr:ABC transporter ATP-binding protein [Bacteroidales bacterium]